MTKVSENIETCTELLELGERNQAAIVNRLTNEMKKNNIDALILSTADAIYYATGYQSLFLYLTGQTGTTVGVLTKEGEISIVLSEFESQAAAEIAEDYGVQLVTYPTWVHIEDFLEEGEVKEVQPDFNRTYRLAIEEVLGKDTSLNLG